MNRLMMLALAGVVAVSLTACGENPSKEPAPATEEAQQQPAATTDSVQPAADAAATDAAAPAADATPATDAAPATTTEGQ